MTLSRFALSLFVLSLFAATTSFAAIDRSATAKAGRAAMQTTLDALDLPMEERIGSLREQGTIGYNNLVSIMFDQHAPLETRWRAVTAAGRMGGAQAMPELNRALQSREWFMRNAGLVAVTQIDRDKALFWSRKFLNDKALIVRAAAVDTIAQLKDKASTATLWTKLYAKENFRKSQSLFIRRRIIEALARLETNGHEAKFVKVLSDADESLYVPAMAALENITKHHMGLSPAEPLKARKTAWERWWKEQGSTTKSL